MNGMDYVQGFVSASDPLLRAAFYIGLSLIFITILMIGFILAMAFYHLLRDKKRRRFIKRWKPLLTETAFNMPADLPSVSPRETELFLVFWNHYHQFLKGDAKTRLNRILRDLKVDSRVLHMYRKGNKKKKLQAIATFGNLLDVTIWDDLYPLALKEDMRFSLIAARTMVQVRPARSVDNLIDLVKKRRDWPLSSVMVLIKEADRDVVSEALFKAIKRNGAHTSRLIMLLDTVSPDRAEELILKLVDSTMDEEIISTCLHVATGPAILVSARAYASHSRWFIRAKAASCLGRLGNEEDVPRLTALLGDREWWVRYRAAEALSALPFMDVAGLKEIRDIHEDRYGRDILSQIIAERAEHDQLARQD